MVSEEFAYVVERRPPDPVCFGSKVTRNTAPIGKHLSPFQKLAAPELHKTSPGSYDIQNITGALQTLKKVRSKKGVGGLANGECRFKEKIFMRIPSPTRYDLGDYWSKTKKCGAPFGSWKKRDDLKESKNPGPGTYKTATKQCRRTKFYYNFGNPTMIPSIETICVSRLIDSCIKCEQLCTGDYWHKEHETFLCHLCWEEEKRTNEMYTQKELKDFNKIRNCRFAHDHENTTAAIRLLHPRKIKKKERLENYLNLYIHC